LGQILLSMVFFVVAISFLINIYMITTHR
jgi:hypothetical protein